MKLFLGKIWKTISWKKDSSNIKAALLLFSCSVMSNSLQLQGMQHARLPCPSPSPRVYSYSCPSSQWCHPTISSSVIPFSSCSQSFPASESFPMSWLFGLGGQRIGASALASILSKNIHGLYSLWSNKELYTTERLSLTHSGRWWRTGKPGMLQSMGSQRVGHNWATEQQHCSITLRKFTLGETL